MKKRRINLPCNKEHFHIKTSILKTFYADGTKEYISFLFQCLWKSGQSIGGPYVFAVLSQVLNPWKGIPPFDNHSGSEQHCPCLPSSVAQSCSCQWLFARICCNVFYFAVTYYTTMQLCGIKLMNLRLKEALTCPVLFLSGQKEMYISLLSG